MLSSRIIKYSKLCSRACITSRVGCKKTKRFQLDDSSLYDSLTNYGMGMIPHNKASILMLPLGGVDQCFLHICPDKDHIKKNHFTIIPSRGQDIGARDIGQGDRHQNQERVKRDHTLHNRLVTLTSYNLYKFCFTQNVHSLLIHRFLIYAYSPSPVYER